MFTVGLRRKFGSFASEGLALYRCGLGFCGLFRGWGFRRMLEPVGFRAFGGLI